MSLVRHAGSQSWYMSFQINNKKYFRSTKTGNKVLARKIEQATKDQIIEKMKLGQEAIPITLEQALTQYTESLKGRKCYYNLLSSHRVILGKRSSNHSKKQPTIYGLEGSQEIHTFKGSEFEMYAERRKKEGTKPSTIKQQLGTIRAAFKYAERLGFLTNHSLTFPNVKQTKSEIVYLTADEEKRLLDAVSPERTGQGYASLENRTGESLQDQYDLVIMLLDTGLRIMEMCQIEWKNINIQEGEMYYHSFKSNKRQTIYMTDRMIEVLTRRLSTKREDQRYVFENSDKTSHRPYYPGWFTRAVRRAKIDKHVTLHKLRSSYASKLVQSGFSLMEVGQLLNHSSPSTTAIYASLVPSHASKKAAALLNNLQK